MDIDSFVAPLDGVKERVGDTILGSEVGWILIEFKRNLSSVKDECRKFSDYEKAKNYFLHEYGHHLIIYGEQSNSRVELVCKEYFSGKKLRVEDALEQGIDGDSFYEYIKKFASFKKKSRKSTGGFSFVAGISGDGKVTKCMRLSEFGQAKQLDKSLLAKLDHSLEPEDSGSSMSPT